MLGLSGDWAAEEPCTLMSCLLGLSHSLIGRGWCLTWEGNNIILKENPGAVVLMSGIPSAYFLLLWLIWKRINLTLLLGTLDLSLWVRMGRGKLLCLWPRKSVCSRLIKLKKSSTEPSLYKCIFVQFLVQSKLTIAQLCRQEEVMPICLPLCIPKEVWMPDIGKEVVRAREDPAVLPSSVWNHRHSQHWHRALSTAADPHVSSYNSSSVTGTRNTYQC